MAPKAKTPAPIDRPLSRAYLREFSGWSTAYPPGLSDPTSLRIMENTQVNRDGSLRIRPGLRYLSYATAPDAEDGSGGVAFDKQLVGTHEVFFLNNGDKAYLFAVREDDGTVGFRVLNFTGESAIVRGLTDPGVEFSIPQGEATIAFTAETTYVKYLQVDNKIFALSDAGETMRMFSVGSQKSARKLLSIERPNWDVADKLTVIHPDAAWITGASADVIRRNWLHNPQFVGTFGWTPDAGTTREQTTVQFKSGTTSMLLKSAPTRRNMMEEPLDDVGTYGIGSWNGGDNGTVSIEGTYMQLSYPTGTAGRDVYAAVGSGLINQVVAGQKYVVAADFGPMHDSVDGAINVRFYNSANLQVGSDYKQTTSVESARKVFSPITAPPGAVSARLRIGMKIKTTSAHTVRFRNIMFVKEGEDTTMFSGDSGPGFSWVGSPNISASIYHPSADVAVTSNKAPVAPGETVKVAAEVRGETVGDAAIGHVFYDAGGNAISTAHTSYAPMSDVAWTRIDRSAVAPALATHVAMRVRFENVPGGEDRYIDEGLLEITGTLGAYFDGDSPPTTTLVYQWDGTPHESTSSLREYADVLGIPTAETPTADTLIRSTPPTTDEFNEGSPYNFAFFYTFSNEIGESAPSQITQIKTQRGWSAWRWETGNAAGEPSGVPVADPARAADQLVAILPQAVYEAALAQEALSWNLYMLQWSNESPVPVTGVKVVVTDLSADPTYEAAGWAQITPQAQNINEEMPVPHISTRRNYSDPSRGGQGLVAADRMVLVHDPEDAAVIRWTSNEQGDYINFSAHRGGGYKTLTSGELMIPAAVKLWQNPESKDTITILCRGVDGHNTSYYMAPAVVNSQSDVVQIMAFEETTATPGTTSPYGCEVFNNALFHPLDEQLMKSTASNYNINHKSQTDMIENRWQRLDNKDQIVSSMLDGRLYYVVHNPRGAALEDGCNGNEVWVLDAASETPSWSRWLIQAHSLRKIEQGGRVYMSVVRPDGIYYLDPLYQQDDWVDPADVTLMVQHRYIPWRIETNTQGANRAHDAWCRLQQMELSLGNFRGNIRWGLKSWDLNGKEVDVSKEIIDSSPTDEIEFLPFDISDALLIRKDVKEWFFYASSIEDTQIVEEEEVVTTRFSTGQINNVQYRYAPVSVNVGYEHGSIETFEYGRAVINAEGNTDAGVPTPFFDRRRP